LNSLTEQSQSRVGLGYSICRRGNPSKY